MRVEQVDFIFVSTRDVERAVAFGRDVLGLPESEYAEGEVEAPSVTFGLSRQEPAGVEFAPNLAGAARRARDVAAAVGGAGAAGAEIIGVEDTGVGHKGFVSDPDGDVLGLRRRCAPRRRRGEG